MFFFFENMHGMPLYDLGLPLWKTVAKENSLIVVHTFLGRYFLTV